MALLKKKKKKPLADTAVVAGKKKKIVSTNPKRQRISGQFNVELRPDTLAGYENISDSKKAEYRDYAKNARCILLIGPKGTGKTTLALALAREVTTPANIEEVPGAVNNGVDFMRALVSRADAASLMGGRKVIIIDEAHKVTTGGVSALLVTLEAKPRTANPALYILCTNEPQTLLGTMKDRAIVIHTPRWTPEALQAFNVKYAALAGVDPLTSKQMEQIDNPRVILTTLQNPDSIEGDDEASVKANTLLGILLVGASTNRPIEQVNFQTLMYMGKILRGLMGMPMFSDGFHDKGMIAKFKARYGVKDGFYAADVARVYRAVGNAIQAASVGNVPPIVLLDVLLAGAINEEIADSLIG